MSSQASGGASRKIPETLSDAQLDLLARLRTNPSNGLTSDQVRERRESSGAGAGAVGLPSQQQQPQYNIVRPPVDCPPALCVILPCIKHWPSMKAFRAIQPDDAEVKRNGSWIRYDCTSLVLGDIIRLEEGDIVPADCVVLSLLPPTTSSSKKKQQQHSDNSSNNNSFAEAELLVDMRAITGEVKPRSAKRVVRRRKKQPCSDGDEEEEEVFVVQPVQLFWGGTVVQGGCIAVVTAIGQDCFVATLIRAGKFPPPANILQTLPANNTTNDDDDDDAVVHRDEAGIALLQQAAFREEPMVRETV